MKVQPNIASAPSLRPSDSTQIDHNAPPPTTPPRCGSINSGKLPIPAKRWEGKQIEQDPSGASTASIAKTKSPLDREINEQVRLHQEIDRLNETMQEDLVGLQWKMMDGGSNVPFEEVHSRFVRNSEQLDQLQGMLKSSLDGVTEMSEKTSKKTSEIIKNMS
jgi:hypothetical protein